MSPQGALLEGSNLPVEGTPFELIRGRVYAAGEVAWSLQEYRGVRFKSEIDVREWSKRVEHQAQEQFDLVISQLRRGSPAECSAAPMPENLKSIAADLEKICETLATLPAPTPQHHDELLRLACVVQRLRALALVRA